MADQIDLSLLTAAERVEYERIVAGEPGRGGVVVATCLAVASLGLIVFAFASMGRADYTFVDDVAGLLGVGAGIGAIAWANTARHDASHARRQSARDVARFLDRIHYRARLDAKNRRTSGSAGAVDGRYASKRQMQHEWYGDHRELNWRDRELAETLGLDADTYVNNFLEHDKD